MVSVPVAPNPYYVALMSGAELVQVSDMLHPPAWSSDALCREYPNVDFFPRRGESNEAAKDVCRRCLCRAECLAFALEHHERGVWGATSEKQRKQLRNGSLSVADVLTALDARARSHRVTGATLEDEPRSLPESQLVSSDKVACHSCEELFAADELVYGSWCASCW